MVTDLDWSDAKTKEGLSLNFIRSVLEKSGYQIMNFGIENHNQEIVKLINRNYSQPTHRRLMSMPDMVVYDPENGIARLVEIKFRDLKYFHKDRTEVMFHYASMKAMIDNWRDAILLIVVPCEPYCYCVEVSKINWNIHFQSKFLNEKGNKDEKWMFIDLYRELPEIFHRVKMEQVISSAKLSGLIPH